MKKIVILAALLAATGAVQAAQTNNGCQGNCPGGDTINNTTNQGGVGYGGTGIGVGGSGFGGAGGNGGAGGAGGAGGQGGSGGAVVGSGNSSAAGGSVTGSGNSDNVNRNEVSQSQGQDQSQRQTANGGNAKASGGNSRNDNASSAQGNTTNTNVAVAGDTVTYEAARIPVATAYAAGLTASNGTCMGSTSAGGQGMSFGFSVGTTWKDGGCDRRYNAQALASVGQAKAAIALLCQDPDIKTAMETAGTPCTATKAEAKAVAMQKAETVAVARSEPIDPIIRARIGLPPLK